MFVALLRFSENKKNAPRYMDAHNDWIQQGFDDGVFVLVGSLAQGAGGVLMAHDCSNEALHARLQQDPFVIHGVVEPEILQIAPGRVDDRLAFLQNSEG